MKDRLNRLQFYTIPKLTLRNLVRNTDGGRIERSLDYDIELRKAVEKKDSVGDDVCILVFSVRNTKGTSAEGGNSSYVVAVEAKMGKNAAEALDNKVKIVCLCADFKYRLAYALNQQENLYRSPATDSVLGIAITQPPVITNPNQDNYLCKHLVAVSQWMEMNEAVEKYFVKKEDN